MRCIRIPDYSAAYVILETDSGLEGHGLTFTIGRGNEICVAAIEAFRHHVVGRHARRSHGRPRRVLAAAGRRLATALARSRKGRRSICDGRHRQRGVGSLREGRAQAGVEAARRHDAGGDRSLHRLPLHHRRADAGRGDRAARAAAIDEGRSRADAAGVRVSRLHDVGRMDRLLRRADPAGVPRRDRRRLDAFQGQGRRDRRRTTTSASRSCARRSVRIAR